MKKFSIKVDNKHLAQAFLQNLKEVGYSVYCTSHETGWIELTIGGKDEVAIYGTAWDAPRGENFILPEQYVEALKYCTDYIHAQSKPKYNVGDVVIASIDKALYIGKYKGPWANDKHELDEWIILDQLGIDSCKRRYGAFAKIERLATKEEIEIYNASIWKEGDYVYITKGYGWAKAGEVVQLGGEYWKRWPMKSGKNDFTAITKSDPKGNSGDILDQIAFREATPQEIQQYQISLFKKGDWIVKTWTSGTSTGDIDIFQVGKITTDLIYNQSPYYRNGSILCDDTTSPAGNLDDDRCIFRLATQQEIDSIRPKNITLLLAGRDVIVSKEYVHVADQDVPIDSIRALFNRFKTIDESRINGFSVQLAIDMPLIKVGCTGPWTIQALQKVIQAADSLK